jgi:zinc protease
VRTGFSKKKIQRFAINKKKRIEFIIPDFNTFILPNRLKVYHCEVPDASLTYTTLVCNAGLLENPIDIPGLSSFVNQLILNPLSLKNSPSHKKLIGMNAVVFSGTTLKEGVNMTCYSLREHQEDAIELLCDTFRMPIIKSETVNRMKNSISEGLRKNAELPFYCAYRILFHQLFGPSHPYGFLNGGTPESIALINKSRILEYHQAYYQPGNSALVVLGNIGRKRIEQFTTQLFMDWKDAAMKCAKVRKPQTSRMKFTIVNHALGQTALLMGHCFGEYDVSDIPKILVLRSMINIRLYERLQKTLGYVFSFLVDIEWRKSLGVLLIQMFVEAKNVGKVIKEIQNVFYELQARVVTENNLILLKNDARVQVIRGFYNHELTVNSICKLFTFDWDDNHYRQVLDGIEQVDKAELLRFSNYLVNMDNFKTILVGPATELKKRIHNIANGPDTLQLDSSDYSC